MLLIIKLYRPQRENRRETDRTIFVLQLHQLTSPTSIALVYISCKALSGSYLLLYLITQHSTPTLVRFYVPLLLQNKFTGFSSK
jgi:hypothetical protein